ncbi:MAG: adenylate/guanylate cyclase domain-containing protein [Comamonadaceae bacterium]
MQTPTTDSLDQQVNATLKGSWLSFFLTDLFQGVGHIALLLLMLEAIWEWGFMFGKPDVYVLSVAALGQSAWLARRRFHGLTLPWWSRLVGLGAYALMESLIEGISFFDKPKHLTFIVLMLMYAWGAALEERADKPWRAISGVCLSRTAQGLGPLLFYIALDVKGMPWVAGVFDFFSSPAHLYLFVLAIMQAGAYISLSLVARRQQTVIVDLTQQLKTLSRWGFGSQVVKDVLRDSGTHAASRIERAIGFIDVRGFTSWSEAHQPEQVIGMLNGFYTAILEACGADLVKSKMSGDEVMLVLPADASTIALMQKALAAAIATLEPMQLTAGAGLWLGPVVEGFFGTPSAQIHDVIGDTVNTAKRLCDHARGGQLLAGPVNAISNGSEETSSIQAKGKTEPVLAAIYAV